VSASAVAAGAGIAAVAAVCFEAAYVLQALEARGVAARHALEPSLLWRLARRPRWLAATALGGVGALLQLLALALAPLAVVQPALVLGLVALLYLGRRVLGEPVGRREIAAAAAIVAGVAAILVAAPADPGRVAAGTGVVVALAALGAVVLAPYAVRIATPAVPVALVVAGAGAGDAWAAFAGKILAEEARGGRWPAALAWAAGAGIALALGLTSEMTALGRLPATRVGPVVQVIQLVVPVLLAAAVLGEDWRATPLGGGVIAAALATVASGAWMLLRSPPVARIEEAARGAPPVEPVEDDVGGGGQRRE
jgi:drug/metabolite transporter (DMT)-like permease